MPRFDTVVKNGMIIDGTRAPRYRGDIGIKDGRITEIGKLHAGDAARELDASGLIVAPGFIECTRTTTLRCFGIPTARFRDGMA